MKVKFLDGHEGEFETLAGANLRRANLWGTDLTHADLRGADLRGADLRGANLSGADLFHASIPDTDLQGANLRYADLRGTDLVDADLRGADLRGANLSGADLFHASIQGADLQGANLRDAELRCTNLRYADLRGADLRGADMRGAEFESGVVCLGALVGAVLDKEQYSRLRDILDKAGETVDDEGTRAQVLRDKEIHSHYEHAKERHPVFADILTHNNNTSAKHYKRLKDEAHANGDCSPLQVLLAEYAEVLEAIAVEDKAQAVYECYDCIAVLLRLVDMIEETAQKESWLEEV